MFFREQFGTVDDVPKDYFDHQRSIYAYVERVIDGDTIRVRHIPLYRFRWSQPQPLQQRGIAQDTLIVRIYGVDTPEVAKQGKKGQPFADTAKEFTADLVLHKMVRITFLRKDQYRRAVAAVTTLGACGGYCAILLPVLKAKDVSLELASAGLAELYTGGGAEYFNNRDVLERRIARAKTQRKGIWSLSKRVSAADYKRDKEGTAAAVPVAANKARPSGKGKLLNSVVTGLELAAG